MSEFLKIKTMAKDSFEILKKSVSSFMEEDAFTYSASISFYTMLSLPAVLLIVVSISATMYEENRIQQELLGQISRLIGEASVSQIEEILQKASSKENMTLWAKTFGFLVLIVSSTSVFVSLQLAINRIWNIEAKPEKGWVKYLINRLLSFAMVIGISFVMMVALVIETLLVFFKKFIHGFSTDLSAILLEISSEILSFGITTLIFCMMYRILPDAKIKWRDVWVGGLITAGLFVIGKILIGIYLGTSSLTSIYGASGSLVILLVWTYYASLVFLFGAKITHVYTKHLEGKIQTYDTAVEVKTIKIEKQ